MANNNLQRHERRDKSKWAVTFIAILLAFVAIAAAFVGIFSDGFMNWDKFKTDEEQQEQPADEEQDGGETANGGAVIGEGESNGVKMMSAKIATADYDEYGISPMAETAYTLTATIVPDTAAYKQVDWTIAFVNPSSEWASGKTVTDYVTVTPTSDGALTANVECLQAFGEQIKVTVTSRDNADATASCTVDYAKKVLDITANMTVTLFNQTTSPLVAKVSDGNVSVPSNATYVKLGTIDYTYSVYTLDDTFEETKSAMGTEEMAAKLREGGISHAQATVPTGETGTWTDQVFVGRWALTGLLVSDLYSLGSSDADTALEIARANATTPISVIKIGLDGTYSSADFEIKFVSPVEGYSIPVSSVSLDNSSIIF